MCNDALPLRPSQMAAIPAQHLLLLDERFIDELVIEILPTGDLLWVIHCVVWRRHSIGEVKAEEGGEDQEGAVVVRITFQQLYRAIGNPGFLQVFRRNHGTTTEGSVFAPFQTLYFEGTVRRITKVCRIAGVVGVGVPVVKMPEFLIPLFRQVPFADVAGRVPSLAEGFWIACLIQ